MLVPLFSLFSLTALSAHKPSEIIRIDLQSPFSALKTGHHLKAYPNLPKYQFKQQLSKKDSFIIKLDCSSTNSTCDKVLEILYKATLKIAIQITCFQPIVVYAQFKSLCNGKVDCEYKDILGAARSASSFIIKDKDDYFTIPQSLLKQLKTNVIPPYNQYDIIAYFNSDVEWYFGTGEVGSRVDFEFVCIHEITHGLGFKSNLIEYSSLSPTSSKNYLVPLPINYNKKQTSYYGIEPFSIYDSFLDGFRDLSTRVSRFGRYSVDINTFIREFEMSGDPFNAAKEVYKLATSGNQRLRVYSNNVKVLCDAPFQPGTSLSHYPKSGFKTRDFLMVPSLLNGSTIDDLIKDVGGLGVYGPNTLLILEMIGYTIDPSKERRDVVLALDYNTTHIDTNSIKNVRKVFLKNMSGVEKDLKDTLTKSNLSSSSSTLTNVSTIPKPKSRLNQLSFNSPTDQISSPMTLKIEQKRKKFGQVEPTKGLKNRFLNVE